jgi:hypothetical protein
MRARGRPGRQLVEAGVGIGLAVLATGFAAGRQRPSETTGSSAATPLKVLLEASPPVTVPEGPVAVPLVPLDGRWDDDASLPAHAESVHSTRLSARLDPLTHTVHGEGRITWRNRSTVPAGELYFHLYLNAFKNDRSLFLRIPLGEGRGSRPPRDWGYIDVRKLVLERSADDGGPLELWKDAEHTSPGDPEDETDVRVPLPSPVPAGGEIELEVEFDAKLPTITERTGYDRSFHMVAQWFPKIARRSPAGEFEHFSFARLSEFDADYGSYDVTIDVPDGFVVGATGERTEERKESGRSITRWVQEDVHDFAFTAWNEWVVREAKAGDVAVRVLSPPGHGPSTELELESVRAALGCYGRRFGKYPYRTLTVVHPPSGAEEAGGMEYPTLITTGGPWYGPPYVRLAESVTVHELGHQFFYGLIATDERRFPFLDEGLNSYAEGACLRELRGRGSVIDALGLAIDNESFHREAAATGGLDDVIARSADTFPSARSYGRMVYSRTATLFHTLAGAYGVEAVERALGRYARAYRFQHPDPRHLLAAFEDVIGAEARENLRLGLFERGWVDYAVTAFQSTKHTTPTGVFDRAAGRETLASSTPTGAYDGWALLVRRGTLRLPVDVELRFADGEMRRERWDGKGDWARLDYSGPSELTSVVIDPDQKISLDERFSNNAASRHPSRIAPRVFERALYAAELFDLLVAP